MLLVLTTFFTIYFIIPSIEENKRIKDSIIPNISAPQKLPRQRHITPSDISDFVSSIVEPIPMEEKLKILNENSMPQHIISKNKNSDENINSEAKKDFKIWEFCYRILKRFK